MSETNDKGRKRNRRHYVAIETCYECGAVGRFRTVSTRVFGKTRVSYMRCRACGAPATFIFTPKKEGGEK